jgi:hypothetical protein
MGVVMRFGEAAPSGFFHYAAASSSRGAVPSSTIGVPSGLTELVGAVVGP